MIVARTLGLLSLLALASTAVANEPAPPPPVPASGVDLVGTWSGRNDTIGDVFGLRSRPRTVEITEQTDRRFRGYFTYEGGRVDVFGVVFPDDASFAWASPQSRGTVQGRILGPDHIAACYVEGGPDATAGCSDLKRTSKAPAREPKPAVAKPPVVPAWPKP